MIMGLKKRIITGILAGCLAVSGVVAYGSALGTVAEKAEQAACTQNLAVCGFNGIEADLSLLVSQGVLTHAQTVTIINAIDNSGFSADEIRLLAEMEGKTIYDRLAESGAIARSLADSIDKAIKARKEVRFAQVIKPMAEAGTYTSEAGGRP